MPNEFIARNGVIALANSTISGSLSVTNSVSGSIFTGSFIGGLTGTSSYASFANTASFATLAFSASYFSGSISNAVFATSASFAATASFALNAGAGGGGTVGGQALLTQSIASTTWSFAHNLGTTYPVITVYDGPSNSVIQPLNIIPSGSNNINIFFSSPKSGYATAVAGGGYFVTNNGTTRKLVQSTPAVTWSFVHNIGDQFPSFEIYDSNNNVVIPANIRAVDSYTAEIQFAYSASGTAIATLGGGIGVGDVITIPSASSAWSIQHNLNTTYPIVTIWESGSNQIVQPDNITSVDANNILVTFTTPVKGFANVSRAGSVISGSTDWNLLINKPNVGVVYSQTTPASTWSIAHNLGTQFPLVTVYDSSNAVVIPQSIVGTDENNITIVFPSAQTGTVNVSRAGNYISGSILWSNITSGPFSTTGSVTRFTGSLSVTGSFAVSTGSAIEFQVNPTGVNIGNIITDSHTITGSVNMSGSFSTVGTITSQTLSAQSITGSTSFITGSTRFGTLATNTHQFTASLNVTGALYVATGSVGIGTISPSQLFEVVGGEVKAGRVDSSQEGGQVSFGRSTDNATAWYIDAYGSTASPQFRFINVTNAAVVMTMTGSSVGIGTSTPAEKLDVIGGAVAAGNGTIRTGITYSSLGLIGTFTNHDLGILTNGTERMRITSGGNVLIGGNDVANLGTTNRIGAFRTDSAGEVYLQLASTGASTVNHAFFYNSSGLGGSIRTVSATISLVNGSDYRMKTNIESLTEGLSIISKLKPCTFEYIATEGNKFEGFIAHELQEVIPNAVFGEKDAMKEDGTPDYQGVDTVKIIPYLVKSIQELTARVQELENK